MRSVKILIISLVTIAIHQSGTSSDNRELHAELKNAPTIPIQAREQIESQRSVEEAQKAVTANPNSPDAHRQLAEAYAKARFYELAVEEFETVLRLKPNDPSAVMGVARSLRSLNRPEDALRILRQTHTAIPQNVPVIRLLIQTLNEREQVYEALEMQKRLCKLEPNDAVEHLTLGQFAMRIGQFEDAIVRSKELVRSRAVGSMHLKVSGTRSLARLNTPMLLSPTERPWLQRLLTRHIVFISKSASRL